MTDRSFFQVADTVTSTCLFSTLSSNLVTDKCSISKSVSHVSDIVQISLRAFDLISTDKSACIAKFRVASVFIFPFSQK